MLEPQVDGRLRRRRREQRHAERHGVQQERTAWRREGEVHRSHEGTARRAAEDDGFSTGCATLYENLERRETLRDFIAGILARRFRGRAFLPRHVNQPANSGRPGVTDSALRKERKLLNKEIQPNPPNAPAASAYVSVQFSCEPSLLYLPQRTSTLLRPISAKEIPNLDARDAGITRCAPHHAHHATRVRRPGANPSPAWPVVQQLTGRWACDGMRGSIYFVPFDGGHSTWRGSTTPPNHETREGHPANDGPHVCAWFALWRVSIKSSWTF